MSRIIAGLSSLLGFCSLAAVFAVVGCLEVDDTPGTLMELKSNMGIARVTYLGI